MSEANTNTSSDSISKSGSKKISWYKSPWVIGWLLLVLVVLAVNSFMIIQSINDFPGLVVEDFYERGQDYEENMLKKLENNEKWTTEFQISEIHLNKPANISFVITDSMGKPAPVEKVTLFAYRPSNAKKDFSVPMNLSDEKKTYQANVTFEIKGKWDLLASLVIEGVEVNYAKTIFVKD
ncbi:MAG: FixH family protein [Gammaproteobacteria bacterium]|nr:FixH family protein [Gammaproteobacteria bacterium]